MEMKGILASNLKKYRKEKEKTQKELALLSGVAHRVIIRIETKDARVTPTIKTLTKLANALQIPLANLLN